MIKKYIKQLAKASFIRNEINAKRVLKFTGVMKRSELREYVKYLKLQIAASYVQIMVPNLKNIDETKIKKQFAKLFSNKKIVIEEDPQLLLGMKIIDDDKIYDFNLKDSFENMNEFFKET